MSGIISQTPYDCSSLTKVSVIASFDALGHIKPLYVRINEESLKVHSVWEKPSIRGIMEFQCKVIDNNCLKPLSLTYHNADNIWTVPK